jgi:hypothetical protein
VAETAVKHEVGSCSVCECPVVRCGTCGTSTCTGIIGCDDCAGAYDLDFELYEARKFQKIEFGTGNSDVPSNPQ